MPQTDVELPNAYAWSRASPITITIPTPSPATAPSKTLLPLAPLRAWIDSISAQETRRLGGGVQELNSQPVGGLPSRRPSEETPGR